MALKTTPFRDGRPGSISGAVISPVTEEPTQGLETPAGTSDQAKEHLARIDKIAADVAEVTQRRDLPHGNGSRGPAGP